MRTSGAIRRELAPVLRTLRDDIAAAKLLLASDSITADVLIRLVAQRTHLEMTLARVSHLNDRWSEMCDRLDGDALEAEEAIQNAFPPLPAGAAAGLEAEHENYMDTYERARALLALIISTIATHQGPAPVQQHQTQRNHNAQQNPQPIDIRLPTLELTKFSGDPRQFRTWWNAFSVAIDSHRSITAFQKHTYLLNCLTAGSTARKSVEHYEPSEVNYPKVISILKERFGDDKRMAESLFSELMHLQRATESVSSLRHLNDTVDRVCYQLEAAGHSPDTPQTLLQIRSKLPEPVIRELVDRERKSADTWKYADLRKALCDIIGAKEEVQRCVEVVNDHAPHQERRQRTTAQHNQSSPQFGSPKEPTRSFVTQNRQSGRNCSLCDRPGHLPSKCQSYPTPKARNDRLKQMGRCLNCLREGHMSRECDSPICCQRCGDRHHFIVCYRTQQSGQQRAGNQPANTFKSGNQIAKRQGQRPARNSGKPQPTISAPAVVSHAEPSTDHIAKPTVCSLAAGDAQWKKNTAFLLTRRVMVSANRRKPIPAIVLFDPGSMASFITKELSDRLQPPRVGREQLEVEAFGGSQRESLCFDSPMYAVQMHRSDGSQEKVVLNRTKQIANRFDVTNLSELPDLASDNDIRNAISISNEAPDIMIGTRHFWRFFQSAREVTPSLFLVNTVFGPLLGGEADFGPRRRATALSMVAINAAVPEPFVTAAKVDEWLSLEGIGIREDPSLNDDDQAVKLFEKSIHQRKDGHYSVKWPWIDSQPTLSSNFRMAYSRLASVLRGLQNRPDLLAKYNEVFTEQLQRGMLEPASRNNEGIECFLPHHPVITHKLRIVIDASAHLRGQPSLNDCLYRGPVLLPDLVGLLIRQRLPKIALVGDLEKAFMSIGLDQGIDREVCKILWLKDPSEPLSPGNLQIWRYAVVGFGVISSPFILAAVVRHHLRTCGPEAERLIDDLYVDNQLLCNGSPEEAIRSYRFVKEVYSKAKMNIRVEPVDNQVY